MYAVIGGAGEVGFHVARALRDEGHSLAVVEEDPRRLERLQSLDVLAIQGNIASRAILEGEARVKDAELFVACTGNDEVNMVAAALAKSLGAQRTIARINNPEYLNVPASDEYNAIGIDVAVSPEMVAAIRVKRMLNQPNLVNAEVFAQGKVFVAEARVAPDAFVVGKRIAEVEPPAGFQLFAIYRADDVIIPRSGVRFQAHDRLLMALTSPSVLEEAESYIGKAKVVEAGPEVKRVMIAGATRVGLHLARLLEQSRRDVVLVDKDPEAARRAGEELSKALVVQGDVTDRRLLTQENVDTFDAFVAATRTEEYNVLAALMAKELGAKLTVALIAQPELKGFLESMRVDLAVVPRLAAVGAILQHVHPGAAEVALQNMGEEQIIVYKVRPDGLAAGKRIRDLAFPRRAIVAAVVHGEEVIMPRGDQVLAAGDLAVVFALSEAVPAVERLLA
ncbi:MAG: Trk system potassium transporter TrkA [Thermoplasmatota archaeon]